METLDYGWERTIDDIFDSSCKDYLNLLMVLGLLDGKKCCMEKNQHNLSGQYETARVMNNVDQYIELILGNINDPNRGEIVSTFESKGHGKRHVDDVMLFAILIGLETLDENLLRLAIEGAKYHDCGRIDDHSPNHALPGALKAYELLKTIKGFNKVELAIIYTAIVNHEFEGNTASIEEFNELLKKAGFEVFAKALINISEGEKPNKEITYTEEELKKAFSLNNSQYLSYDSLKEEIYKVVTAVRDGDALDRVRFSRKSPSALNPLYLSKTAMKYLSFAYQLAEAYSIVDLGMMASKYGLTKNDMIRLIKLVNASNPKELLIVINKTHILEGQAFKRERVSKI